MAEEQSMSTQFSTAWRLQTEAFLSSPLGPSTFWTGNWRLGDAVAPCFDKLKTFVHTQAEASPEDCDGPKDQHEYPCLPLPNLPVFPSVSRYLRLKSIKGAIFESWKRFISQNAIHFVDAQAWKFAPSARIKGGPWTINWQPPDKFLIFIGLKCQSGPRSLTSPAPPSLD